MDLAYRCEILGITRAQLARYLGRSLSTVTRWCSTSLEHPAWLVDWMEYVEMELMCGRDPQRMPRKRRERDLILYPATTRLKRPRKPNGSRDAMLAKREVAREARNFKRRNRERMARNRKPHVLVPLGLVKGDLKP